MEYVWFLNTWHAFFTDAGDYDELLYHTVVYKTYEAACAEAEQAVETYGTTEHGWSVEGCREFGRYWKTSMSSRGGVYFEVTRKTVHE